MGNTINTTSELLYIKKTDTDGSGVNIPPHMWGVLEFDADSKYKIRTIKNDELIAKIWTGTNGNIIKFKNYDKHIFIISDYDEIRIGSQLKDILKNPKDVNYIEILVIGKRHDKKHLVVPPIV
jgi:hypothetical protein